jgi:hypothetical protein
VTSVARFAGVLLAVVACRAKSPPEQGASVVSPDATNDAATDASPDVSPDAAPDAPVIAQEEFPNARIRLKLRFQSPAAGERTIEQTVWLRGSRFHVRDEAGRSLNEILGDVTAPRGLGKPARTMEEIMDRDDAARKKAPGVTDLYGDLSSGAGLVVRWTDKPWAKSARDMVPIARQVLSGERTATLTPAGDVKRLGRKATEYKGAIEVQENGRPMKSNVVRIAAPPFLLLDEARDASIEDFYYVREVVALDEGVVTEADVSPPSP